MDRPWADPLVFQELNSQAEELLAQRFEKILSSIRQRYFCGIDVAGSLSVGFVLLKRKKLFLKGRTWSHRCELSPFPIESASVSIHVLPSTDATHCIGKVWTLTLPCIWKSLHRYFEESPSWIQLEERNDDLVGFFNSVPRQMILTSLDLLTKQYQEIPVFSCLR